MGNFRDVLTFFSLAILLTLVATARADRLTATWIGPTGTGGDGNWSTPSNWNLGVIPTNGRDGNGDGVPDIYDVRIDALPGVNSTVRGGSAIAGLQIESGDTLDLTASNLFMTDPDGEAEIANSGNIRVTAPAQTLRLFFAGEALRLSGSGTIDLGTEFGQPGAMAPVEGGRLINGLNHTLRTMGHNRIGRIGAYISTIGDLRATLTNNGSIVASEDGTLELSLSGATHYNEGTIEASTEGLISLFSVPGSALVNRGRIITGEGNPDAAGRIEINGFNLSNEPQGVIMADNAGAITFYSSPSGSVLNRGLIEAANRGGIRIEGKNIVNEGQGTVQARSGGSISLINGTFRPDSTIRVLDSGSRLFITGNAVFENENNVLSAGPGTLSIGGALIRGGEVTDGLGLLELTPSDSGTYARLEDVRLKGTASGNGFIARGTLTIDTSFTMGHNGSVNIIGDNLTIAGAGISMFKGSIDLDAREGTSIHVSDEHTAIFDWVDIQASVRNSGTLRAIHMNVTGVLSGRGTVVCPSVIIAGTISPGDGIGILPIVGDVTIWGTYAAELGEGTSDLLQVTGGLTLNAEFGEDLVLSGGIQGKSYVIAQYSGERTGIFDNVTPGYEVIYDDTAKQIRVEVIPEPATWVLCVVAAAVLARGNLRAKRGR